MLAFFSLAFLTVLYYLYLDFSKETSTRLWFTPHGPLIIFNQQKIKKGGVSPGQAVCFKSMFSLSCGQAQRQLVFTLKYYVKYFVQTWPDCGPAMYCHYTKHELSSGLNYCSQACACGKNMDLNVSA